LITPDVVALRERLEIPGMKVLQFGFGDKGAHIYLPHRYERNCVSYTGTHDNDTTANWWETLDADTKKHAEAYLGAQNRNVHWSLIRACLASPAQYAIVPFQDVLGLGADARMNTPSRPEGNWGWRYPAGALTKNCAEKLATLVDVTDREPLSAGK